MLVPEATSVPPPRASDRIATPGANTSVVALLLAKGAALSCRSVAPTEITLLRQAGDDIPVAEPLFADEATVSTPIARSVFTAAAPAMLNAVVLSHAPANSALVPRLMLMTCTPSDALLAIT